MYEAINSDRSSFQWARFGLVWCSVVWFGLGLGWVGLYLPLWRGLWGGGGGTVGLGVLGEFRRVSMTCGVLMVYFMVATLVEFTENTN